MNQMNKAFMPYFLLGDERMKKWVKTLIEYGSVILVVVLLRSFIITPALVDGDSMETTLSNRNVILLNKFDYRFNKVRRFDIVVVKFGERKLVKRVIGLPGEHVEYRDNNLYIDGFLVEENFSHDKSTADFRLETLGYITIPGDKYFVVGDNRNNSTDSRTVGLIDKKQVMGSVSFRLFPLNKIGKIK